MCNVFFVLYELLHTVIFFGSNCLRNRHVTVLCAWTQILIKRNTRFLHWIFLFLHFLWVSSAYFLSLLLSRHCKFTSNNQSTVLGTVHNHGNNSSAVLSFPVLFLRSWQHCLPENVIALSIAWYLWSFLWNQHTKLLLNNSQICVMVLLIQNLLRFNPCDKN